MLAIKLPLLDKVAVRVKCVKTAAVGWPTPEHEVMFSDGLESDYLEFNSGVTATTSVAEKVGTLVQ